MPTSHLNTTNPYQLSHGERNAILGQGGLVPVMCPVWMKRGEQGRDQVTQDRPFKHIQTIKCHCKKVLTYELRIVRIPGGLVVLKKKDSVNGILVPVAHNQRAHDFIPSSSRRGTITGPASSPSHTQKEFIVKHARLDKNRDLFIKRMIDSPNVLCNDEQIAAPFDFKRAVFNFLARNTKYIQPSHELETTL